MEGIYEIRFRGASDWGMGLLHLQGGKITGSDAGGVSYNGTYENQAGALFVKITLTVPPGATLVQGTAPQPRAYEVPFEAKIPKEALENQQPVLVSLPPGPVNVIFKKLRDL